MELYLTTLLELLQDIAIYLGFAVAFFLTVFLLFLGMKSDKEGKDALFIIMFIVFLLVGVGIVYAPAAISNDNVGDSP